MRKIFFTCLILFFLINSTDLMGQYNSRSIKKNNTKLSFYSGNIRTKRNNAFEYAGVGISLNALNYYGDLSPVPTKFSTDISFTKPGIGISYFRRFGTRYAVSGQFMYATLTGSDAESAKKGGDDYRLLRNLSFRNQIKELSVTAIIDLFENRSTYLNRPSWTPYFFVGVAAFLHNPQTQEPARFLDGSSNPDAGKWVNLQSVGTEGQQSSTSTLLSTDANYGIKPYSLLQVAVPFGVGARFKINEVFDLWADIGFRYTFTDYLDDVSKNYVDLSRFKDPLAAALSNRTYELPANVLQNIIDRKHLTRTQVDVVSTNGTKVPLNVINGFGNEYATNNRGNSKYNDIYMVTSIKLTYIISSSLNKPRYR